MNVIRAGISAYLLCLAGFVVADEPVAALKTAPAKIDFATAVWTKPQVLKSVEESEKLFGKEGLDSLAKEVDFAKQIVVVFAWRGSGGDKLNYTVAESSPEQIVFALVRGRTRDLRQHTQVYVLRKNVVWSVKAD